MNGYEFCIVALSLLFAFGPATYFIVLDIRYCYRRR